MTPEQEEQVRRALAAVGGADDEGDDRQPTSVDHTAHHSTDHSTDHTADRRRQPPLPPDVAARLETVLAELVAQRSPAAAPAAEDELAQRRRRWPNALVAAAALCVIALAGGAVATGGFGLASSNNTQTAGSAAGSAPDPGLDSGSPDPGSPDQDSPDQGSVAPSTQPRELAASGSAPILRTDTLTRDIERLVDRPGQLPTGSPPAWRCVAPSPAAGEQVLGVRLDGLRSSLVLGQPTNGERTARVYSCADPDVLVASTTVGTPAR